MSRVAMDALRAEFSSGRRLVAEEFERLADHDGLWTCVRKGCEQLPRHEARACGQVCRRPGCPETSFHYQSDCPRLGRRLERTESSKQLAREALDAIGPRLLKIEEEK